MTDDVLDDLFHGCAFAAYVEMAAACGARPDPDATRRLAYRMYEEELAAIQKGSKPAVDSEGARGTTTRNDDGSGRKNGSHPRG